MKTAMITGATGGLGEAITKEFLKAGYNLYLVGTSKTKLENLKKSLAPNPKQKVICHEINFLNLTDESISSMKEKCMREFGSPYVIVNNAGITGEVGLSYEIPAKKYMDALQINLFAVIEICRFFIPLMMRSKEGKIINVSGGGSTSPRPNFSPYSLSKTVLVRYTENLAAELELLRPDIKISANCIAPGLMNTNMTKDILSKGEERIGSKEYNSLSQKMQSGTTSPEIPARLCEYLASPNGDEINGKLISAVWDKWETLHKNLELLKQTDLYTLRRITL